MTDEPDALHPQPDADAVRRLLADARHTGPMPDDVVDRMDAVLADLAGQSGRARGARRRSHPCDRRLPRRPASSPRGRDARCRSRHRGGWRRRRPAPARLQQPVEPLGREPRGGPLGSSSAGGRRVRPDAPQANRGDLTAGAAQIRGGRLLVRPQHFTADALAGRRVLESRTPPSAYELLSRSASSCGGPGAGGERVRATYQRAPAVLVFHAPGSSSQVVDLYLCGSSSPVRSATLPSP